MCADPIVLWEDTKKGVDSIRKASPDKQKLLQHLNIDEQSLEAWYMGVSALPQITTKLRQQIAKLYTCNTDKQRQQQRSTGRLNTTVIAPMTLAQGTSSQDGAKGKTAADFSAKYLEKVRRTYGSDSDTWKDFVNTLKRYDEVKKCGQLQQHHYEEHIKAIKDLFKNTPDLIHEYANWLPANVKKLCQADNREQTTPATTAAAAVAGAQNEFPASVTDVNVADQDPGKKRGLMGFSEELGPSKKPRLKPKMSDFDNDIEKILRDKHGPNPEKWRADKTTMALFKGTDMWQQWIKNGNTDGELTKQLRGKVGALKYKRIAEIAPGADETWRVIECPPSEAELIAKLVISQLGHVNIKKTPEGQIVPVRVQKNINAHLRAHYDIECKRIEKEIAGKTYGLPQLTPANEVLLFHGARSDPKTEASILEHGFSGFKSSRDLFYGEGSYFATDCKLSCLYAQPNACKDFYNQPKDANNGHQRVSFLVVRVVCGDMGNCDAIDNHPQFQQLLHSPAYQNAPPKTKASWASQWRRDLMKMPEKRDSPAGMTHTQIGVDRSGTRKANTEVIVKNTNRAFPAYRVTVDLADKHSLLHPLGAGNAGLWTLQELTNFLHRQRRSSPTNGGEIPL